MGFTDSLVLITYTNLEITAPLLPGYITPRVAPGLLTNDQRANLIGKRDKSTVTDTAFVATSRPKPNTHGRSGLLVIRAKNQHLQQVQTLTALFWRYM